jgi:hypothetical protein
MSSAKAETVQARSDAAQKERKVMFIEEKKL